MRHEIVEFVSEIASILMLRNDTVHVAMSYVDSFQARVQAPGSQLLLAASACLVLAAKFMESEQHDDGCSAVPLYSHVVEAMGNPTGCFL